jgi:hypothetical protein
VGVQGFDQKAVAGRATTSGKGGGVDTAATRKLVSSSCPGLSSGTSPLPLSAAGVAAAGAEVSLIVDLASEGWEVLASAMAPVDSSIGLSMLVSALRLPCVRAAGWV